MPLTRKFALFGYLLAGLLTDFAHAAVARLDDSASRRSVVPAQVVIGDNGRPFAEARRSTQVTIKFGAVDYRLTTAGFIGHRARIYYVVPPFVAGLLSPDALRVEWRSLGKFASGAARPGERTLVWSGIVNTPWIEESFDVNMRLDLRQYRPRGQVPFAVESYFEIETLP